MRKNLIVLMALIGLYSHAQNVNGKIIDVFGHPIENAYVLNTTTESHAHTNESGVFNIEKTVSGNILKISALGYKKAVFTMTDEVILITLEEDCFQLSEVIIQPKLSAMNVITKIDLETSPVNSTQEILRKVPGLFIGQHAGGGKAEQLF